jgi:hypothetical protein
MADKDFVVKNGLVVNTAFTVNSTALYYNGSSVISNSYVITLGGNVTLNQTTLTIGTTSVNSSGFFLNGQVLETSGGYYKGNNGAQGNTANKANLYRINANTQTANITIEAGENAVTVGPIVIDDGYNLTVETGGRAVIV